jgi:hypothetical protein
MAEFRGRMYAELAQYGRASHRVRRVDVEDMAVRRQDRDPVPRL